MFIVSVFNKWIMPILKDYIGQLKYKDEMTALKINFGAGWETNVNEVSSRETYRFVFNRMEEKNHIPVYINKPQRALMDNRREVGGYGLSCLETFKAAETYYNNLKIHVKNIATSIGDSIAKGEIVKTDGVTDDSNALKHFNLYEFDNCDLRCKFVVVKQMV